MKTPEMHIWNGVVFLDTLGTPALLCRFAVGGIVEQEIGRICTKHSLHWPWVEGFKGV